MDFRVKRFPKVRSIPNPEESLRSLVERAPEAEAWADHMKARLHPTLTMLYSIRRRLATGAVTAFAIWMFVHVMFGANGMVVYKAKKAEYQSLETEIDSLKKENQGYTQQIQSLQSDPKTIEKEAREQLHYARPGEVVYVAPAPPPQQRPTNNAARK